MFSLLGRCGTPFWLSEWLELPKRWCRGTAGLGWSVWGAAPKKVPSKHGRNGSGWVEIGCFADWKPFQGGGLHPRTVPGGWQFGPRASTNRPQHTAACDSGQRLGLLVGVWAACRSGHSAPPFVLLCKGELSCGCNEGFCCPLHSADRTVPVSHSFLIK